MYIFAISALYKNHIIIYIIIISTNGHAPTWYTRSTLSPFSYILYSTISFQYTSLLHLIQCPSLFLLNPSSCDTSSFNQHVPIVWRKRFSGRTEPTFVINCFDLEWEHKHFQILIGRTQYFTRNSD